MKLKGKICIVTGASSGMGRAIARLFAQEGATVIAAARRLERLEELAKENTNIKPMQVDVSEKAQVVDMVKNTVSKYGRVDVLINNAGVLDDFIPLGELTDELWQRLMRINVDAPMYAMREALPAMLNQGGGVFVTIASIGGLHGSRAGVAYTVSKHAVIGLSRNVAFQYGPQNIRSNVICPGAVKTEIASSMGNVSQLGYQRATVGGGTMIRMGEAEEIATAALFLACDDSSFVNGAELVVDGAQTAY